jgi:hypothetical protein
MGGVSREHTEIHLVWPGKPIFTKEARSIQECALRGGTRVVKFGPIIYFCANRDAWMLDPQEHSARCLMCDGETLPLGIIEKPTQFSVEFTADYQIEGDIFNVMEPSGKVRSIAGYPTRLIEPLS